MTTGERIKQFRKQLGLTQEELGDRIGVGKAAINKYETGIVVNLKQSTINNLSKALGISPVMLLGGTDPDLSLSADETILIEGYRSLTSEGKQYMLTQLTAAKAIYGGKDTPAAAESV